MNAGVRSHMFETKLFQLIGAYYVPVILYITLCILGHII